MFSIMMYHIEYKKSISGHLRSAAVYSCEYNVRLSAFRSITYIKHFPHPLYRVCLIHTKYLFQIIETTMHFAHAFYILVIV